uniref:Uncharacterized protein n=1 Tax=Arundo donax TaxID=35708 RepID=A0A0A9STA4_ARUDO
MYTEEEQVLNWKRWLRRRERPGGRQ